MARHARSVLLLGTSPGALGAMPGVWDSYFSQVSIVPDHKLVAGMLRNYRNDCLRFIQFVVMLQALVGRATCRACVSRHRMTIWLSENPLPGLGEKYLASQIVRAPGQIIFTPVASVDSHLG